jgi:hypothetical protein
MKDPKRRNWKDFVCVKGPVTGNTVYITYQAAKESQEDDVVSMKICEAKFYQWRLECQICRL